MGIPVDTVEDVEGPILTASEEDDLSVLRHGVSFGWNPPGTSTLFNMALILL